MRALSCLVDKKPEEKERSVQTRLSGLFKSMVYNGALIPTERDFL